MANSPSGTTPKQSRRPNRGSELVRARLIDAAMIEFAAHGFEGASTRAIAARADTHQPQINYHFDSKEALWRAVFEQLMDELDLAMVVDEEEPRAVMEVIIRGMVRFAAARPELSRLMMHEGTAPSDRLTWLVETHIRPRYRVLRVLWAELSERGECAEIDGDLLYHSLIGGASLLYANAPEARLLMGIEPSEPAIVEAHAEALIAMFLPAPR
jgi:TetR/AcrR family transcriptional regulator